MALTLEDGSCPAGADTYATLATINAYATSRGLTFAITGADETPAEQAARRAYVWLNTTYRSRLTGYRTNGRDQTGEFPRINCHDNQEPPEFLESDEIPQEWIDAQCEAAVREKVSPGSLNPDVTPGKIKRSFTAGQVSVSYAIGSGSAREQRPDIGVIDRILEPLIGGGSSVLSGRTSRT